MERFQFSQATTTPLRGVHYRVQWITNAFCTMHMKSDFATFHSVDDMLQRLN